MLALSLFGTAASAQGYEGTWRGGPVRMQVSIESWGQDCGPRPQSHTGEATGSVRISEAGDQLVFNGTPVRRTDACWSENRMVRRVSSTAEDGRWRVVCRTRPDDPRAETGTYTLTASGTDTLNYREVSDYDWQLNESRCKARMTVTQRFSRVGAAATPTPEQPTPEQPSCTPGEPARIRLRPSEAEVEPGGQVRFSARVVDAAGCPVRGQHVRLTLSEPEGANATIDDGLFTAAENAAEAEGEFEVRASAGSLRAEASVVVRTADLSDLIARRATVGVTQTVDEDFEITAESAAGVSARAEESTDEERSILPFVIGAIVVLALLLGVVVLVVARRGGKQPAPAPSPAPNEEGPAAAPPVASAEDPALDSAQRLAIPRSCPVCHREFDDPSVTFCPEDGAQLGPRSEPPMGQALICPTCRRGFGAGTTRCPSDGDELIPYALFVKRHQEAQEGGKICPTCGERYGRQVTFCGKDGAELVVVNWGSGPPTRAARD